MMKRTLLLSVAWVNLFAGETQSAPPQPARASALLRPTHLRCEYLVAPVGLDAAPPRLSWQVESEQRGQRQTAYRILVASTAEKLAAHQGDLWDTGKVASDETVNVAYAGQTSKAGARARGPPATAAPRRAGQRP